MSSEKPTPSLKLVSNSEIAPGTPVAATGKSLQEVIQGIEPQTPLEQNLTPNAPGTPTNSSNTEASSVVNQGPDGELTPSTPKPVPTTEKQVDGTLSNAPTPIDAEPRQEGVYELSRARLLDALPKEKKVFGERLYDLMLNTKGLRDIAAGKDIYAFNRSLTILDNKLLEQEYILKGSRERQLFLQKEIEIFENIMSVAPEGSGRITLPPDQHVHLLGPLEKYRTEQSRQKENEADVLTVMSQLQSTIDNQKQQRDDVARRITAVYERELAEPRAKIETLTRARQQIELDLAVMSYDHSQLDDELQPFIEQYETLKAMAERSSIWSKSEKAKILKGRRDHIVGVQNTMTEQRMQLEDRLAQVIAKLDTAVRKIEPLEQQQQKYKSVYEVRASATSESDKTNENTPDSTSANAQDTSPDGEVTRQEEGSTVPPTEEAATTLELKEGKANVQQMVQAWNQFMVSVRGVSPTEKQQLTIKLNEYLQALRGAARGGVFRRPEVPATAQISMQQFISITEKFLKVKKVPAGLIRMAVNSFTDRR